MKKIPLRLRLAFGMVFTIPLVASTFLGLPHRAAAAEESEKIKVELCDGETTTTVDPKAERSPENGMKIAAELMSQWRHNHPDTTWVTAVKERHTIVPPVDNSGLIKEASQGQTYGQITALDVKTWERELEKQVVEGARIFHSGDELGSTIAVSCDMCHPDASNTHPETYPKFQVQLGRVALLRDMINWCLQHPVRAEQWEPDNPRMRAVESYIMAQRKGTPMAYGKR